MISLVNFKFNKMDLPTPQNIKSFRQNFRGHSEDMFIKSGENKDMSDNLYKQRNKTLDMNVTIKRYLEKISVLPLIMDRVMGSAGRYICGKDEADEFSKKFLDGASSLATRIEIGEDSEEYSKCYKPELDFIREISPICDDFCNEKLAKESFDSKIEQHVVDYANDETVRTKHFIS